MSRGADWKQTPFYRGFRYHPAAMDLNTLLLWIAGPSCLLTLIQAVRASPRLRGWIFVSLAILAVGGTAYWLRPDIAGDIAGSLWAIFVLGPSLIQRLTRRWIAQQKFERAALPAMFASILHPFDGIPQLSKFLHALSLAEQGQIEPAIAILGVLESTAPAHMARSAAVHSRRLSNDWPALVAWVESEMDPKRLLKEPNILPIYVRALGETGQLGKMLQVAAMSRLSLHPQLAVSRSMCRLHCFVFCGDPARVTDLFDGPLSLLPATAQRYWIATAAYAAGMPDTAARDLKVLEAFASPGLRIAIQNRLANPPAPANSILVESDIALLRQLDLEQEHDQTFSHTPGRGWRPWVTFALVLANAAMFAVEWEKGAGPGRWLVGGTMNDQVLLHLGAMNGYVLRTHQFSRLFMANFLHYGYAHIFMNMLALLILGPFVELRLGRIVYLSLYLISGIGVMATVLFLQLHRWMDPNQELVGASGAIMAIIGATAAILLRGWYRERATAAARRLQILAFIIALQVTFDHFTPEVSGAAHIAGIVWGFVLASLLPHRNAQPRNAE